MYSNATPSLMPDERAGILDELCHVDNKSSCGPAERHRRRPSRT
jgi:hypothetical protein